ncbi:hypothetical protein KCP73_02225 [Salmonella enterica subsp. enterica]|nr:hypothetical protein KCP73_02225 [Salmonella enterica subsp. enterica]
MSAWIPSPERFGMKVNINGTDAVVSLIFLAELGNLLRNGKTVWCFQATLSRGDWGVVLRGEY